MFQISKRPTIKEIHDLYESGVAKPSQVTSFFLNRSKKNDKEINSVLRFTEELARKKSIELDNLLDSFDKSDDSWFQRLLTFYPLFGIPYNLKDNI